MKKWIFVIFPGAMLGVFLVFYLAELKRIQEREQIHATETARQLKAEADKQAALREKSEADARQRAATRAAEEAKKEKDKLDRWNAEGQKIKDDTDRALADTAKSVKTLAELDIQLSNLRIAREKTNREYLELLKSVERAKIDRRTAEMELQRLTEMIARRASDSSMTRVPPPPPPSS